MAICLPVSVIEQKNYYMNNIITDELDKKHSRLQQLKKEYAIMLKNNRLEDDNVQAMAQEIEALSNELVHKHPYYMPLDRFKGTNWEDLKKNLKTGEVVYQYVLTENGKSKTYNALNKVFSGEKYVMAIQGKADIQSEPEYPAIPSTK